MSIDIEKINEALKDEKFVGELGKNMSVKSIKEKFKSMKDLDLSDEDAGEFLKIVSEMKKKVDSGEIDLDKVSGGKSGLKHIGDGAAGLGSATGYLVGSTVAGAGKIVYGVGKSAWRLVEIPCRLVYSLGEGVLEGFDRTMNGE